MIIPSASLRSCRGDIAQAAPAPRLKNRLNSQVSLVPFVPCMQHDSNAFQGLHITPFHLKNALKLQNTLEIPDPVDDPAALQPLQRKEAMIQHVDAMIVVREGYNACACECVRLIEQTRKLDGVLPCILTLSFTTP